MGQQCSHTVKDAQEVLVHYHFEPSSDQLKIQIESMRKKNQELLDTASKHKCAEGRQEFHGYLQNGIKQGYGELKTSDQKRYYGYFKDNVPHIKGVLIFSDNHYYIGQFHMGKMHGKGKEISPYFSFEGQFSFDKKKYGRLLTEDFKYEGSFQEQTSLFGGYGQLCYQNGQKYMGNFLNGLFDGQGMYFDNMGQLIYQGEWKNGLYDGVGKYYWQDGSYFEGEYREGHKHGEGKFRKLGQSVIEGVWQNGEIRQKYMDEEMGEDEKVKNNKSSYSTKMQEIY